jgi:uncharacterized hydrophobic protein (TIGR00271 family)
VLVHLRLNSPSDLTDAVVAALLDRDDVTNLTFERDASLRPEGDVVCVDVAREAVGEVMSALRATGLHERGGIVLTSPTGTPFREAGRLEARVPGHPDDAVIWDAVEEQARSGAVPTVSYHVFLVIAVALGAIAVVTDSAVLVVGAMVVGPEFSAVVAVSAGIALRQWGLLWSGARLLVLSFAAAILVVAALALVGRWAGLLSPDDVTSPRPNTGFIWHPDAWSVIVALLAGAAGALALALSRTNTMVGVFISVTTVPAAGNLALGLATWQVGEIAGSAAQLGINIGCMVVAGTLVLLVMKVGWTRLSSWSEKVFGRQADLGTLP